MKHMYHSSRAIVLVAMVCMGLMFSVTARAQANGHAGHEDHHSSFGDSLDGFNADAVMQRAFANNLGPGEAALYLAKCKRQYIDRRYGLTRTQGNTNTLASMRVPNNALVMPPCTNMDFEAGNFTGWTGFIGDNTASSSGPLQNIVNGFFSNGMDALVTDASARHTIVSAASGNDPCGGFPCVAPGGNYSVRLGGSTANYQGEAIEQTFTVGPGNTSFTYEYAVVLNDGGHSTGEQPYFRIEMYDQSGNLIPCAQYYVEASGTIPGFINCGVGTSYKPWTTVNADLTNYVTQNVTIRFTAAGCIYAGHYGYAYVDASCVPYAILTSDSLCAGNTITLSAPAGAQSYYWSPGGQTTSTIQVNTPGSYTVDMQSVTGCYTQLTINIGQYPQPTASFTPTFPPCSPNYTFTNNSTISSGTLYYHWDFGDPLLTNDTSNVQTPTFNYPNPGTYTVTLIVTSASGCVDTATMVVSPGNGGQAAFSANTVCFNSATVFTDQSNGATGWSWNFGDPASAAADSSQLQNPTHLYTAPGTYTVTLTAQTNPCPSVITQTVTVYPQPTASFAYNQVCGNQLVNFTSTSTVGAPSTITSTAWDFGDPASGGNNTSTLLNPSHTFSAPGTYTVTLVITTGNNCTQTTTQVITVGLAPTAAFTATTVCTNTPMTFTNNSINGNSYFWDFGDPSVTTDTTSAASPTYTYTNAGTYNVMLIANPGPCSDTSILAVTVAPGPQVLFAAPQTCLNDPTIFTDQSSITSGNIVGWSWDFGVGALSNDTSNLQNPTYTYATAGTYTVSLTCTSNNGCQTTNTMTITVNPLPAANFSSDVVCVGAPTTFTDLSGTPGGTITGWVWDFGDGSPTSSTQNPQHTYTNDSTYNVTLIIQNSFGCLDTVNLAAVTAAMPQVLFTADTFAGCPMLCVDFLDQTTIASGAITGWTWDFGDNTPPSYSQSPSHCYNVTGTYTVTLTATSNGGCATTLVIPDMIEVYPVPHASFFATPPITTVVNTDIQFTDLSQGNPVTWQWDFGDPATGTDVSALQNPLYTYSNEYGSIYPVHLTVTNQYGCVDDTLLEVIVEPEFTFFIPNAFTPNNDGVNDGFYGTGIGITSYEIWIFDRWGNLIFNSKDMNQPWDGSVQGRGGDICQIDTYVWKVTLTDVFDKKHKYIGHVNLIR